ncbi:MAG: cation:proton antiporter, partial [Tepidisphaeraceae bacterium]
MHLSLILILLLQIALVLALSRAMGVLFARLRQPQVMGEMVAGIMLGPSLLGWLAPGVSAQLFPPESIQYLNILSQVGVIFFLFLIGLELDPKLIRNRGHAAVVISHVSIIAPFLLGAALALYLYPRLFNAAPHMRFTAVALFMGAAMSITAFPVLARILTERNLHKTKVGAITITCAAVDDVSAWCMLAFVVAVARAQGLESAVMTAIASAAYVVVMFFVIRPFLGRLQAVYDRQGRLSQNVVAAIFLLVLASAFTTELIGIHALFGAFLMGAIMPKGTQFVRHVSEKLEDFTVVFLLPIFFAYTGLKTHIGLINNTELWVDTLLIIAVACLGKFGGSTIAARACGLGWREASAIGTLMNTRGLMELVILNIGQELGVITDAVFAMMVIMALVTTALTTPVLSLVYPARLFVEEKAKAVIKVAGKAFSVLIPIANPRSGGPLLRLADMLVDAASGQRIFALHLRRPVEHEAYRAGLDESADNETAPAMKALLEQPHSAPVEPISFVSSDVPADIVQVAQAWNVDLILMGFHKPVFSHTILGGTVHRILS